MKALQYLPGKRGGGWQTRGQEGATTNAPRRAPLPHRPVCRQEGNYTTARRGGGRQGLPRTHQGMALSMPACRKGDRKGLTWAGLALPPVAMETAASSTAQL